MREITNAIGGRRVWTKSGRSQPVYNPATGEEVALVPLSSAEEVGEAIAAAKAAAESWGRTPAQKRARFMFRFKELVESHADDIARAISAEHGKTHADALGEVQRGLEVIEFACGIPHLQKGEFSRNVGPEIDT
jgi:malonate-semialdehyde dehydrogenase (acetylating)/methylmalonate-semialdehyde dehydrogenase